MQPEQTIHLTEYYHMLLKHKWTIIIPLLLISSLTTFYTFRMKPVYQATSIVVIEKERTRSPLTGESLDYETFLNRGFSFRTHAKLIVSRPVLRRVIKNLKLDQPHKEKTLEVSLWRETLSQFKKNIYLLLKRKKENTLTETTPEIRMDRLTAMLQSKILIKPIKDTHLLNISVEDHNPVLARDITNALLQAYIEFNLTNRLKSSRSSLNWMQDQLYETKKKLEDAEEEFLAYKERKRLFSIEGRQAMIASKIDNVNNEYVEARNLRAGLDTRLKELQHTLKSGKDISHIRTLIDNPLVDNLYSQFLEAEMEHSRLSKVYKSKHPRMIQINTRIANTHEKLDNEIRKEANSLSSQLSVLLEKEKILQKTLEDFENDAMETNRKELKYIIFKRNVATNQKLYDLLLTKIEESNVTGDIDVSNIRIAEKAVTPTAPVRPDKKRNIMIGLILGLMTGIGLAFLLEYLDQTLHTADDIEKYLDLPVLSVIPVANPDKPTVLVPVTDK